MKDEKYLEENHIEIPMGSIPSKVGYEKMIEGLYPPKQSEDYKSMECHDFIVLGTDGEFETLMCKDCGYKTIRNICDIQGNAEDKGIKR